MPENDKQIRPLESIHDWRNRIRFKNKYGVYGGELNPSIITAERTPKPTGTWMQRIKNFIHPYGKRKDVEEEAYARKSFVNKHYKELDYTNPEKVANYVEALKSYRIPSDILDEFDKKTDEYRGNYASSILPFKKDSNQNDFLSQMWRWYSRKKGFQSKGVESFSNKGTDVIDLDKNVIRLTPKSRQSTALFNEFVESKRPSVNKASEYQNGKIKSFGDLHDIPTKNISLYAGIEDGHFKLDSLNHFNPETVIYPARNIKRSVRPIKKFIINAVDSDTGVSPEAAWEIGIVHGNIDPWYFTRDRVIRGDEEKFPSFEQDRQEYEHYRDSITNEIDKALKQGKTLTATRLLFGDNSVEKPESSRKLRDIITVIPIYDGNGNSNWIMDDRRYYTGFYSPRLRAKQDSLYTISKDTEKYINNESGKGYSYIDTKGVEHPISDYNASILDSKMVFGNPSGGKFIGRIQDISKAQLDSLNAWLSKNPSWLIRPDLGSFSQYRLDSPSLGEYLKQYYEHPKPEDPNVFTIGTTEPNKVW